MAMYDSEAFWQDFMRRPEAQKALKLEQKILMKEQAQALRKEYDAESADLKSELLECSLEVKKIIGPIVKYPMVHRLLYNFLKDCRERKLCFNEELSKPSSTIGSQLRALYEEWKADPQNVKAIEEKWTEICLGAKESINQESYKQKEHTWRDMPQNELSERLSKGEIMPRDEWIPGLSKGKRKLDSHSLKQHLNLGEQMRRDGKEAFEKQDYEMSLTRFTQAVQLLNWVEGTNENDSQLVEEMYLINLRNQAQAALKCHKYHECLKACNTIIQEVDEHDAKAYYRRGRAYAALGMVKYAKDDYMTIIKSPFADSDSINAAKAAISDLRKIVNNYKTATKKIMEKTVSEDTFSNGREPANLETVDETPQSRRKQSWFQPQTKNAESPKLASPHLDLEATKMLLEDLLECYTSSDVQKELQQCRKLADYDERRVLIRIRKFIPDIQMPILRRYNLANEDNNYDYTDSKRLMETTVAYWRPQDPEVKQLASECWDAVFGELANIDF